MAKNTNKNKKKNKANDPLDTSPGGGLYEGSAGDAFIKDDPQAYFNAVMGMAGRGPTATSPTYQDWLQNEGFRDAYTGYTNAVAGNELLEFRNHLFNTSGSSFGAPTPPTPLGASAASPVAGGGKTGKGGKKGRRKKATGNPAEATNPFAAGPTGNTPGNIASQMDQQFLKTMAEREPRERAFGGLRAAGFDNAFVMSDAMDFFHNSWFPKTYADFWNARAANPTLAFEDYMKSRGG